MVHVAVAVRGAQGFDRRQGRFAAEQRGESGGVERAEQKTQPVRAFGMAAASVVRQGRRVGEK
jgi:hypothetical protein